MIGGLWTVALLVPLPLAIAAISCSDRPWILSLAPLAPVPALVVGLAGGVPDVRLDAVVLGTELRLDDTGRVMLVLSALVWIAASAFVRGWLPDGPRRQRFAAFFLLAMTGSLVLPACFDLVSFYTAFSLISLAGYGLVAHGRDGRAAGRLYVVYVILGETVLLAGMLVAVELGGSIEVEAARAALAGGGAGELAAALFLAGFAVKAAAFPLHSWAPISYRASPAPAAAVLSGAMAAAGVLGWLRFLPLGEAELAGLGAACIAAGLGSAYLAAVVGALQREPKPALAYSSVSQMGLMVTAVGVALVEPSAWPLALGVVSYFVLHHGLAKASLFLGVGVAERGGGAGALFWAGMAVPALAIAAAPVTSGALAKSELKHVAEALGEPGSLTLLIAASGAATTLVLARVLVLVARLEPDPYRGPADRRALLAAWLPLVAAVAAAPFAAPALLPLEGVAPYVPSLGGALDSAWPVAAGVGIALAAGELARRAPALRRVTIPPGDIAVPLATWLAALDPVLQRLEMAATRLTERGDEWMGRLAEREIGPDVERIDRAISSWVAAGTLLVVISSALIVLLV